MAHFLSTEDSSNMYFISVKAYSWKAKIENFLFQMYSYDIGLDLVTNL